MRDVTANEMRVLLRIAKDFTTKYNANSLSKDVGLSAMGVLKIVNKLQEQGLLVTEVVGKAKIFRVNYENNYTRQYLSFLLRKEAEEAIPQVKRWVSELRKLELKAKIGVLFGSVLNNKEFKDVDVLIVLEQKNNILLNKELDMIKQLSAKHIHPVKQTMSDFQENLLQEDKVMVSAVKRGIVMFGYKEFVEVLSNVTRKK